jgi:plastocyanin
VTRVRRSATVVLLVAGALAVAVPAGAAERVVQIGRDGVRPQVLQAEPGDTVRFVNDDPTFAYRAQGTGGPWRFDSGPTALLEADFVVPAALTSPGTYRYRVAQDAPFIGSVVVGGGPAPTAAPASPAVAPSGSPSAAALPPTAAASPRPAVAAPAVRGPLAGPRNDRALGLAVTVGVVLLVGVASLLLRLLLAVPVLSDRAGRL